MIVFENRRKRESIIVGVMVKMYCSSIHSRKFDLCSDCDALIHYANLKLDRCIFGNTKPVCKECSIHCYSTIKRQQIRQIMRWAGPRMIVRHPVLALIHILDNITASKVKIESR